MEAPPHWPEVLARFRAGDEAAARRLAGIALGFLARFGAFRHRDAWDDIAQEVLIRLWRSADRIENAERLLGWLRTTTWRAFADWCAKHGHAPEPLDASVPEPPGEATLPELVALQEALGHLPGVQREVIEAIYVKGMSFAEAARALSLPEGTLRTHRTRAMKTLRRHLLAGASSDSLAHRVDLKGGPGR